MCFADGRPKRPHLNKDAPFLRAIECLGAITSQPILGGVCTENVVRIDRHCHVVGLAGGDLWPLASMMTKISYRGYRFPPVIIQQAIWLYARFTLSLRDVEDLLAERGIRSPTRRCAAG